MRAWNRNILICLFLVLFVMPAGAATEEKVLVIGLDGADWDVMEPLLAEGQMPNLAGLMEDGRHGNLTTTFPIESPVAWTSMTTGTTPGKHGIYGFIHRDGGAFVPTTAEDVRVPRVWDRVGETGQVVVMNVPQTFPPQQVNGSLVGGYLSLPDVGYTYPEGLQEEIEREGYEIEALNGSFEDVGKDRFLDRLPVVVEKRTDAAERLLNRTDWRLGFVVYTGLDRLQHYTWSDMEEDTEYGDAILDHYALLDEQIGRLVEQAGENTTVLVVSDHGFGPLRKNIYLNTWLQQNGYMELKTGDGGGGGFFGITQQQVVDVLARFGILEPVKAVAEFLGFNPGASLPSPGLSDIDVAASQAYAGNFGGKIHLTASVPETERDALLTEISDGLRSITDPDTGEPVFEAVHRAEDVYTGDREDAPDLILEPRPGYRAVGFLGRRAVVKEPPLKTGTHTRDGIYVLTVPGEGGDAHITDITPTILDALGLEPLDGMDGTSLLKPVEDGS